MKGCSWPRPRKAEGRDAPVAKKADLIFDESKVLAAAARERGWDEEKLSVHVSNPSGQLMEVQRLTRTTWVGSCTRRASRARARNQFGAQGSLPTVTRGRMLTCCNTTSIRCSGSVTPSFSRSGRRVLHLSRARISSRYSTT
jgi:hypothetical protein